jgi:MSHA biogenesis protein MshK
MDEAVNRLMLAALLLASGCAHAQGLPDPTRPATAAPAAFADAAPAAQLGHLQAVLIGRRPGGRRIAVIDGKMLRVGDKFGTTVLVSISDDAVILRSGTKLTPLKLFPAQQKRATGAARGLDVEQ